MALGIAGSEAAGLRRNFGTMTKPFHPGNAARSGIVAAKLASRGYTADPDIIEGRQGYADNFGGVKCNLPAVTKYLGHLYLLEAQGTRIKPWPCCGGNHQTLTGLMELIHNEEINPDDVDHIEFTGPSVPCTGALLRAEVNEGLEGKFCLAYNISAAIVDRKVDLSTFTDERSDRGDLQEFMQRVSVGRSADVELRNEHIADGNPESRIKIHMRDGGLHDVELGPALHLTGDAVIDKFRVNAGFVFDQEKVSEPIRLVQNLDELGEVSALMDTVTTAG
jgi:2-methylcitrate dehydratase PrpD